MSVLLPSQLLSPVRPVVGGIVVRLRPWCLNPIDGSDAPDHHPAFVNEPEIVHPGPASPAMLS